MKILTIIIMLIALCSSCEMASESSVASEDNDGNNEINIIDSDVKIEMTKHEIYMFELTNDFENIETNLTEEL